MLKLAPGTQAKLHNNASLGMELPLNQILLGDAIDLLKTLPDNSIDLIATDPPYFKVKTEDWDNQWGNAAEFLNWIDLIAEQWARILKPNGSIYCFASPQMSARVEVKLSERFNVLNRITWFKPQGRYKSCCKEAQRAFRPASESIIFCEHRNSDQAAKGEDDRLRGFVFEPIRAYLAEERRKSGATAKQIIEATGCYTVERHAFQKSQWELPTEARYLMLQNAFPGYFLRSYEDLRRSYEDLRRYFHVTTEVPNIDVWNFDTVFPYKGKHPCEKPLALMRHIVNSSSRPRDIVLDPFMGSGTTAIACIETGRNFIGVERDPNYQQLALKRIQSARKPCLA